MNINLMDADALDKLKAEGVEFIRVDQSYIDGVAKATREWEDKYIAADGGWFKKVVEQPARVHGAVEATNQYRSEFRYGSAVAGSAQRAGRGRPSAPRRWCRCASGRAMRSAVFSGRSRPRW